MSKFKSSVFGGYNKADVNAEISALNKKIEEAEAEKKRLKHEAESAEIRVSELEKQISELKAANEDFKAEKHENEKIYGDIAKIYKRAYGAGREIVCDSKETADKLLSEIEKHFENTMGETAGMIDEYAAIQRDIADIFSQLNEKLSYTADSAAAMLKRAKAFAEIYGGIKNTVEKSAEGAQILLAEYDAAAAEFTVREQKEESAFKPEEKLEKQTDIAEAEPETYAEPKAYTVKPHLITPAVQENTATETPTEQADEPTGKKSENGKTDSFTQFGRKSKISAEDRSELLRKALLKNGGNWITDLAIDKQEKAW